MLHVVLVNKNREVTSLLNNTVHSALKLEGISGRTYITNLYDELTEMLKKLKNEPDVLLIADLDHVEWLGWQVNDYPFIKNTPTVVVSAAGRMTREKIYDRTKRIDPESLVIIDIEDQEKAVSLRPLVRAFSFMERRGTIKRATGTAFRRALAQCESGADFVVPATNSGRMQKSRAECAPK